MKTTEQMTNKTAPALEKQTTAHGVKSLVTGVLLTLATICGGNATAQTSDVVKDTTKTETVKPETKTNGGVFMIDPTYSPNDKVGTVRLQGAGSVHGIGVSGFIDLTGTPDNPTDVASVFGKINITKSTDKIIKGTSVGVTYVLNSKAEDKLLGGIGYRTKIGDGSLIFKAFPVSNKGFEASVGVIADQKFGKNFSTAGFVLTDIKGKTYYGELEATYKISKNIAALTQMRVSGTYTGKPHVGAYFGLRATIK